MPNEQEQLLCEIAQAMSNYIVTHGSYPVRIWLSPEAGLILTNELRDGSKLLEVPAEVTKILKGVSFVMAHPGGGFALRKLPPVN